MSFVVIKSNQTTVVTHPTPTRVIEVEGQGASGEGQTEVPSRELLAVGIVGQTAFTLLSTAARPQLSQLFINGVKATYGSEYTINGLFLSWLMTSLQLQPGDEVEIFYL